MYNDVTAVLPNNLALAKCYAAMACASELLLIRALPKCRCPQSDAGTLCNDLAAAKSAAAWQSIAYTATRRQSTCFDAAARLHLAKT